MKTTYLIGPRILGFALCFAILSSGKAEMITTLVAPGAPIQAGATVVIELAGMNTGASPAEFRLDSVVAGTLTSGARTWPVELRATLTTPTTVAAHGFALLRYSLEVPREATGPGTLRIEQGGGMLMAELDIAAPVNAIARTENSVTPSPAATSRQAIVMADVDSSVFGRTFVGRLNAHEATYFIYGGGEQAAKFQLSFKYKVVEFENDASSSTLSSLQMGYTQRSLWDIDGDSSPFYDTSYMPELFWEYFKVPHLDQSGNLSWLGLQTGVRHESNGREGLDSRSLNIGFVRGGFNIGRFDGWHLMLMPEVWAYIEKSDNEDIQDYRGYGRIRGLFGRNDGAALSFTLNSGRDFNHGSVQFDLTTPVRGNYLDLLIFFHLQYFSGYGESLRNYDQKSHALRAGFSLVR